MKLKPIRSSFDLFLAIHFSFQLYGHFLLIFICNHFQLQCSINPRSEFLIGFYLLILGQKIKKEGASFPVFVSILIEINYILLIYHILPPFLYFLPSLFYVIFLLSLYIFQRYEVPSKNSPYKVGYRKFVLDQFQDISKHVAVLYPTEETTQDVVWLPEEHILFSSYQFNTFFNYFRSLADFSLSFLHTLTLGVNLNSKISDLSKTDFPNKETYPVIIFSHGYGGSRHCYSIFTKWLASQGAIVFCTEHNDGKKPDLQKRYEVVKAVLDFIYDPNKVEELFEAPIKINYEKVSVAGHSMGGGTALYSAIFEKRITGGVLALDPFVVLISDQLLNLEWSIPTLSICTERFNQALVHFKNHEKIENLYKKNKSKDKSMLCYLQNSSHFQQGDLVCLAPRLLKLIKVIDRKGDVGEQLEFNLKLLEFFFEDVIIHNKTIEFVKEKFWTHIKESMKIEDKKSLRIVV